jgi:hypothetical protein
MSGAVKRRGHRAAVGVSILALVAGLVIAVPAAAGEEVETGDVPLSAAQTLVDYNGRHVAFEHSFVDPVLVLGPASRIDYLQPLTLRADNVTTTGFDLFLDEWDYLDGWHGAERVDYLVAERGHHVLAGGTEVVAGSVETQATRSAVWVEFGVELPSAPAVFATVASRRGEDAIVTRVSGVTTTGFSLLLQEQEVNPKWHVRERIDFIAWEMGLSDAADQIVWETTSAEVDHNFTAITYAGSYPSGGCLFADMNTRVGNNPAGLRWQSRTDGMVEFRVDEEQSADEELWHFGEMVAVLIVDCVG